MAGFTYIAPPTITTFTPTTAATGNTVTITGTNFTGATAVSFGGVAATSFSVVNSTTITAVLGTGASGNVSVTTAGGTASLVGFTYIAPPTITTFTPTTAATGSTVTITGTNFTNATAVSFGGVAATSFNIVNSATITAVVGIGASGSVSVTTAGGTASLAGFTNIPQPSISFFSPTVAATGNTVTITGTNFTGATAVSFGGIAATSFNVVNSTTITAVVGSGASGTISITTAGGTVSLAGFTYAAAPSISYPSGNKIFTIGTTISPLNPTNIGGTPQGTGVTVSTLAGSGAGFNDGTGTAASFNYPYDVALDANGNVYVADRFNHRIRKISPAGVVTTLAGSGNAGYVDGIGTAASFNYPAGVAVDGSGNVYVADQENRRIRKISPTGLVTTLAGSGSAGYVDGVGTAASFSAPRSVAIDNAGNVYVADLNGNNIRKISPTGLVTTLAGSSGDAAYADGTGTAARFSTPFGVAVDAGGIVYVADRYNHRIRKIFASGFVTTLAGSGNAAYADGTSTTASFNQPSSVAVDNNGNVYVADAFNDRIRKINPAGIVTTLAGGGGTGPFGVVSPMVMALPQAFTIRSA